MRVEIPGDPISVGRPRVFLSVFDSRLKYNPNYSDEVNRVTESIGVCDGGGSYFNLHTGSNGFGIKVDDKTMAVYLKRFGVPADQINELPLDHTGIDWSGVRPGSSRNEVGSVKVCTGCRKETSSCKDCSLCSGVPYCGKECQKKDWYIHKIFCGLNGQVPSSQPNDSGETTVIKAFLFPEGSDTPRFVNLPLTWVEGDEDDITDTGYNKLDVSEFIPGITEKIRSDMFTDLAIRSLQQAYHVIVKGDFMVDGHSKINICALNLFKKYEKMSKSGALSTPTDPYWRNNIIVVKAEAGKEDSYQDIGIADATEVVKFLYKYTSSHGLVL